MIEDDEEAPPGKATREFSRGLLRGFGLAIPGILFAIVTTVSEKNLGVEDGVKVAGAIYIIIYALMGFLILNPRVHKKHGRVALASYSFFTLSIGVLRLFHLVEIIDEDMNRIINTVVAVVLGSILAYAVYLHYLVEELIEFLDGDGDE